uniref:Uncharacterized protein n=1 Tax=Strigamia maritima TaxID=126957 RepID=T1IQQ7_STRMM
MWVFKAVTSIRDSCISLAILSRLASIPRTHRSVKDTILSLSNRIDLGTKNQVDRYSRQRSLPHCYPSLDKQPWLWLRIEWGIMLLPGSFSGKVSSPRPDRGPEPRKRISLAILMMLHAITFNAPCTSAIESLLANASNLLGAVLNGSPIKKKNRTTFSAKPFLVFNPVPTAVPPAAKKYKR